MASPGALSVSCKYGGCVERLAVRQVAKSKTKEKHKTQRSEISTS